MDGPISGTVSEFDHDKGYGRIAGEAEANGGSSFFFHCTQISDGTRTITPGAAVVFEIRPWHRGEFEAAAITKL
jgi:cold shock CspA family protein